MHTNPFKLLLVIAAPLASACANAGPLSLPVAVPSPVAPAVSGAVNTAMPYFGDVPNIRPIRGPGNIQLVPLPGLEEIGVDKIKPSRTEQRQ